MTRNGERWTLEELSILREMYEGGRSVEAIVERLGRTKPAVVRRVHLAQVKRRVKLQRVFRRYSSRYNPGSAWELDDYLGQL